MKKSEKKVHPMNKNFRYLLWTIVGIFILIGLASAYVYVSDDGIDMDDNPINNATNTAPIGSIMAWAGNLSGVPTLPVGWVECNGQTLSDSDSQLNGVTIPDLNGDNRFLRGDSTSGGTGGSEDSSTSLNTAGSSGNLDCGYWDYGNSILNGVEQGGVGDIFMISQNDCSAGSNTYDIMNTNTKSFSTIPPYYNVIMIMRVK